MATYTLVDRRIEDGQHVLAILDHAGLQVIVALWLYSSDWDEWRLALASPLVDSDGPRRFYQRIQEALNGALGARPELRLDQMTAMSISQPLIAALRGSNLRRPDVNGTRLRGWSVGGVFVEDAYVYRVD